MGFVSVSIKILLGPQKYSDPVWENPALRRQLATMKRTAKQPRLRTKNRLFWVFLFCIRTNWQEALIIVNPESRLYYIGD